MSWTNAVRRISPGGAAELMAIAATCFYLWASPASVHSQRQEYRRWTPAKAQLIAAYSPARAEAVDWNPRLALEYLDGRQKEWFAWAPAKSTGGPCLSCHTGLTYLWARPQLRRALGEMQPSAYETGLLNGLRARLDKREAKSETAARGLGVESIFAALCLAQAEEGSGGMSNESRQAFDRLWFLQQRDGALKGAWLWYDFKVDPYETPDSAFFGATLAALAVGHTPASYRKEKDVRGHVDALTHYLASAYAAQPLHNQLMAAWAARELPGAMPKAAVRTIVHEALSKQARDGSWSIESLGPWMEHPAAKPAAGVNSYATGFAAFLLQEAGVRASEPHIAAALEWLRAHQDPDSGYWDAISMNKQHPVGSMQSLFMRDAATSFAVLALTAAGQDSKR